MKVGRCGIFLYNKVNILFLFFLIYLFKVLIIIIIVLGIFCIFCSGFKILKLKYFWGFLKYFLVKRYFCVILFICIMFLNLGNFIVMFFVMFLMNILGFNVIYELK